MDVYTHGLRCQIVPADRDDGGRLEYDIFGAPYSDNVVTSAATFATTEEARAALETHAAEVAARIAAAPGEFATITRLIEDAGYSVRPSPAICTWRSARPVVITRPTSGSTHSAGGARTTRTCKWRCAAWRGATSPQRPRRPTSEGGGRRSGAQDGLHGRCAPGDGDTLFAIVPRRQAYRMLRREVVPWPACPATVTV